MGDSIQSQCNDFIVKWDFQFPFDYFFRKKTGIRFGPKEHKNTSIFEIYIFLQEEKILERERELFEEHKKKKDLYKLTGKLFQKGEIIKMSDEEVLNILQTLDLKKLQAKNGNEQPT